MKAGIYFQPNYLHTSMHRGLLHSFATPVYHFCSCCNYPLCLNMQSHMKFPVGLALWCAGLYTQLTAGCLYRWSKDSPSLLWHSGFTHLLVGSVLACLLDWYIQIISLALKLWSTSTLAWCTAQVFLKPLAYFFSLSFPFSFVESNVLLNFLTSLAFSDRMWQDCFLWLEMLFSWFF